MSIVRELDGQELTLLWITYLNKQMLKELLT